MISRARYVMINGNFLPADGPCLMAGNRGFLYGEIAHRSMRAASGKAFFFDYYFDSLHDELVQRGFRLPQLFRGKLVEHDVFLLLQKCRVYQGAWVRMSVYRDGGDGLLFGDDDSVSVMLEAWKHPQQEFVLNEVPVKISISEDVILPESGRTMTDAGRLLRRSSNDPQHCLLFMNKHHHIVQAAGANLVLVKGRELYFPPVEALVTRDVICDVFADTVTNAGYRIVENALVNPYDMAGFDEVLLLDSLHGLRWIGAFGEKRYFRKQADVLCRLLVEASKTT
ncbi:MAG TPA: aminotransferase class IV [Bacteroidales bacterium]|nr:aminotransferase class IV [Bacteroidales bacterium]